MAKISTLRKYRTDGTAGEAIYPKTVTSAIIDWDSSMISGDVDLSNTVQYTVQSKTNSEKLLARQNIDAVSSAEVSSVVYSAVNSSFATTSESINSRINSLESQLNTSIKLQVVPFGGLVNNPRVSYSYIQSTYYTDVVYDTARKQWLAYYNGTYYTSFENSDKYEDEDVIYTANGHVYLWNGSELVADNDGIEGSGGTDYSSQISTLNTEVSGIDGRVTTLESNVLSVSSTQQQLSTRVGDLSAQVESITSGTEGEIDTATILANIGTVSYNEIAHRTVMFDGFIESSGSTYTTAQGSANSSYDHIYYDNSTNKFVAVTGTTIYSDWDRYDEFMTIGATPYEEKVYCNSDNSSLYTYNASENTLSSSSEEAFDRINNLNSSITTLTGNVSTASTNITTLQTNVSRIDNSVTTNTSNITDLDLRVTQLEEGSTGEVATEKEILRFDGFVQNVTLQLAAIATPRAILYDTTRHVFVASVIRYQQPVYYQSWPSIDDYMTLSSGSYEPYDNKIYLYEGKANVYYDGRLYQVDEETYDYVQDVDVNLTELTTRVSTAESAITSVQSTASTNRTAITNLGTHVSTLEDATYTQIQVRSITTSITSNEVQTVPLGGYIIVGTNSATYIDQWNVYRRTANTGNISDFVLAFKYSDYNTSLLTYPATITAPKNDVVTAKIYVENFYYYELNGVKFLMYIDPSNPDPSMLYNGANAWVVLDNDEDKLSVKIFNPSGYHPINNSSMSASVNGSDFTIPLLPNGSTFESAGLDLYVRSVYNDSSMKIVTLTYFNNMRDNWYTVGDRVIVVEDEPVQQTQPSVAIYINTFNGWTKERDL